MRLPALDGLRALSILLVLAAHLLPLELVGSGLNGATGTMGMALFFALSGFLIVRFLAEGMPVATFAVRRLARVVPLAWLAALVLWAANGGNLAANLLFAANLPPTQFIYGGGHLWSLCVEVQFYAAVALLCLFPSRRSLLLVPVLCLGVTALRIVNAEPVSIVTWHRVDEILAGGIVALAWCGWFGKAPEAILRRIPVPVALLALFACSHTDAGPLLYLRPYTGALVLGSALYGLDRFSERLLVNRPAAYIAEISYALYVIHGMLAYSWLGSGGDVERYLKRPLLLGATFALAHVSTRYMERPIGAWVRQRKVEGQAA